MKCLKARAGVDRCNENCTKKKCWYERIYPDDLPFTTNQKLYVDDERIERRFSSRQEMAEHIKKHLPDFWEFLLYFREAGMVPTEVKCYTSKTDEHKEQ